MTKYRPIKFLYHNQVVVIFRVNKKLLKNLFSLWYFYYIM